MFTGIIERVARVISQTETSQGAILKIETGWTDLSLGESVAVNGVCLTVAELSPEGVATFFLSLETLRLTPLLACARVNLERALLAHQRLSGHWVQGHVDGMGKISSVRQTGDDREILIEIPSQLTRYCVPKGSIAINGISLTINRIEATKISLQIIPHTWHHTQLPDLRVGDPVTIEVDILAKYVERLQMKQENTFL